MTKAERDKLRLVCERERGKFIHIEPEMILALLDSIPEWCPMETAPKDGTRILIAWKHDNLSSCVEIGFWNDKEAFWVNDKNLRLWFDVVGWMPLPEVLDA